MPDGALRDMSVSSLLAHERAVVRAEPATPGSARLKRADSQTAHLE